MFLFNSLNFNVDDIANAFLYSHSGNRRCWSDDIDSNITLIPCTNDILYYFNISVLIKTLVKYSGKSVNIAPPVIE